MPLRYRAFVTISAGTGMRRGGLLGLTMDRVAFDFAAADQRLEDLDGLPGTDLDRGEVVSQVVGCGIGAD